MKLYIIYNPEVKHRYDITEIVNMVCDCNISPLNPAWLVPKYHKEQWSEEDINKIQLAPLACCDGALLCDISEDSEVRALIARAMGCKVYNVDDLEEWYRKVEL